MLSEKDLLAMKIQMLEFLVQRLFFERFRGNDTPIQDIQDYAEAMRNGLEDTFRDHGEGDISDSQLAFVEILNAFWDSTIARARTTVER